MAVEIRAVREEEIPEVIELMCSAFGEGIRACATAGHAEGAVPDLERCRVLVEDGRLVSYAQVADRTIRIGKSAVRMGGVGGVCTHPDRQRRGHSEAVLRDAVAYMERAGYHLSMLYTRFHAHYGKVGWAPLPAEHKFRVVPPPRPPQVDTPYRVRDFDEARDLAAVMRVYDEHNARRTLTTVRTEAYWRRGILPRWVAVRPAQGRPAGAGQGHPEPSRGAAEISGQVVAYLHADRAVREVGYLPGHVEALRALVARLFQEARDANWEIVQGVIPENHPFVEMVRQVGGRRIGHELREGMMMRVIRLAALLEQIAPELQDRLEASCLEPADTSLGLREAGQEAAVEIRRGQVRVREGRAPVTLEMGTRDFCKMLTGESTFGQMRELLGGRTAHVNQEHAALLEALFPKGDPVYWDCDHF
jgi:predicted N-acetyltransferase YhbS